MTVTRDFDYVVVGSGFWGATIARKIAESDRKVLVLEKRNHIGGNSYSYADAKTNVEIHKYGSHIFQTSDYDVWQFVTQFAEFNNYRHQIMANVAGELYEFPINTNTIRKVFDADEIPDLVEVDTPMNFQQAALKSVGKTLYEMFYKGYTEKQWGCDAHEVPASMFSRVPVRNDTSRDYFNDIHVGVPIDGYGSLFKRMLDHENILVLTNTTYGSTKLKREAKIFYSGPLDELFNFRAGQLSWRSLWFTLEWLDRPSLQDQTIVNYPDKEIRHTRVHEYKHYWPHKNVAKDRTVFSYEFPADCWRRDKGIWVDEPYYPVRAPHDVKMQKNYEDMCGYDKRDIIPGGRLGSYRYLNMDQTVKEALKTYDNHFKT